jgi:hypothetical protein
VAACHALPPWGLLSDSLLSEFPSVVQCDLGTTRDRAVFQGWMPASGETRICCYWILVEAGGIEPPSEDLQELATTRLFRDLELALRTPADGLP